MAGAGRKTWTNEVLSQPDLQNYLQDQTVMAFNDAATRVAAIPAPTEGMHSYQRDAHRPEVYNGAAWVPSQYGQVRGKLWRTQGFSGALANNTEYVVNMGASRVSGGFTTVPDALSIPYDGLYDLDWQGYVSGGVVGIVNFWVRRTHPGVGDNILGSGILNKTYAGVDSQGSFANRNVPLRAGNTLRLIVYQYAGPLTFYGITETSGCFLTATYTGPLNGALPV